MQALSDAELVANHLAEGGSGTTVWLQELFRRHYARVVTWCLRIAGDRDEASDLAQAVFVKAHRHLHSFRGESRVSTWLYSITRSECMNYLKSRRSRPDDIDDDLLDEMPDSSESGPEEALDHQRTVHLAREFLEQELNETEKLVFAMHYGDDTPLDAITRLLGLTNRSGAKAYIVSARRKLSRAIGRWKAAQDRLDA
ncbi:MAG TPA: sigma-70 family RNA polymerase sigma factor [Myxococcales bacterium]|nr:sigma-70 family RNA polymerase sigma factor [Myxococcales bacterium]